jgi:hypothetical protein
MLALMRAIDATVLRSKDSSPENYGKCWEAISDWRGWLMTKKKEEERRRKRKKKKKTKKDEE